MIQVSTDIFQFFFHSLDMAPGQIFLDGCHKSFPVFDPIVVAVGVVMIKHIIDLAGQSGKIQGLFLLQR